jgi:rubrerythrin
LLNKKKKHIFEINEYFKDKKLVTQGDNPADTKNFFHATIEKFKKKLPYSEHDSQAYEHAMQLENEAYNFYKERAAEAEAEADDVKDFFNWLMKQEMAHYDFLRLGYDFIKDPEHYNINNEEWLFEG